MKIVSIGGGPAGLYFSLLMKKAFPDVDITVLERNKADDTFGWGVVFSRETLDRFARADQQSHDQIVDSFVYWNDIDTWYRGSCIRSTGHGFSGLARKRLLTILQERCRQLGVKMHFETEVKDETRFAAADLILAADGSNSFLRRKYAACFKPGVDWRHCKFAWLGTTKPLDAFTFIFKESDYGLFQVHAYPFQKNLSTWIVECHEDVWKRAHLDQASEADTVAFCEELFREFLGGHPLLCNRSIWRSFPTVTNACWSHGRIVLMGDSAHTAHFSIGSGTKLAMEDAMALVEAFKTLGRENVPAVQKAYEASRRVDVAKLQKAAQTSLEWFENAARYLDQPPLPFTFNLLTRSKRVTYENLRLRDPLLVGRVNEWYRTQAGAPLDSLGQAPPPAFTLFKLRSLELKNRIVVSPMCQYSARDGCPGDWHLVHLGSRAVGGAGLVMTEMTNVLAEGRISLRCAGLYREEHVQGWKRVVDFVHQHTSARIGLQLGHAGRKGSVEHPPLGGEDRPLGGEQRWTTLAPSPLPFKPDWPIPKAMDRQDMARIREAFVRSTRMAQEAGFDLLEVHMAHGYLLATFISPLTNRRRDDYGGSLENRMRFPLEVFRAMRQVWPQEKPMLARISASDWVPKGGLAPAQAVEVARLLKEAGCDMIDVSSGGTVPDAQIVYGRMYQVPFAEKIRYEANVPVMAVGAITGADHAHTVLAAGRADLAAMARPHLFDPYLTLHAAAREGFPDALWPPPYLPGKNPPRPTV